MTSSLVRSFRVLAVQLSIAIVAVSAGCVSATDTPGDNTDLSGDVAAAPEALASEAASSSAVSEQDTAALLGGVTPQASVCCTHFICSIDHEAKSAWCKGSNTSPGAASQQCVRLCGGSCDSTGLICAGP